VKGRLLHKSAGKPHITWRGFAPHLPCHGLAAERKSSEWFEWGLKRQKASNKPTFSEFRKPLIQSTNCCSDPKLPGKPDDGPFLPFLESPQSNFIPQSQPLSVSGSISQTTTVFLFETMVAVMNSLRAARLAVSSPQTKVTIPPLFPRDTDSFRRLYVSLDCIRQRAQD
jgi:hypothetical protein